MFPITPEEQPSVPTLPNYSIVETPADHNGTERILIDELLTQDQCNDLMDLTQVLYILSYYGVLLASYI